LRAPDGRKNLRTPERVVFAGKFLRRGLAEEEIPGAAVEDEAMAVMESSGRRFWGGGDGDGLGFGDQVEVTEVQASDTMSKRLGSTRMIPESHLCSIYIAQYGAQLVTDYN
jgi:hypothetical protein